jgi:aminomethyltransferase
MAEAQKTALFETHKANGGRIVDFAGWMLPVSYTSVLKEHECVRTSCGLFDVSHMGEIRVNGPQAKDYLQYALTNNIDKLTIHNGQYTALLNEHGGFVDDLIVYRLGEQEFLLCVNAANIEKDFLWLRKVAESYDAHVENESSQWSQIAVQGPRSKEALLAAFHLS